MALMMSTRRWMASAGKRIRLDDARFIRGLRKVLRASHGKGRIWAKKQTLYDSFDGLAHFTLDAFWFTNADRTRLLSFLHRLAHKRVGATERRRCQRNVQSDTRQVHPRMAFNQPVFNFRSKCVQRMFGEGCSTDEDKTCSWSRGLGSKKKSVGSKCVPTQDSWGHCWRPSRTGAGNVEWQAGERCHSRVGKDWVVATQPWVRKLAGRDPTIGISVQQGRHSCCGCTTKNVGEHQRRHSWIGMARVQGELHGNGAQSTRSRSAP